jgi:selenocysteine lyase/cysteine desulfurase
VSSPLEALLPQIRAKFPRSERDAFGRRRAFFDNGAGALVLGQAAQAEHETRVNFSAEPDSIQEESVEGGRRIALGRAAVADLLRAPTPESIVSGESTTALLWDLSYALRAELSGRENVVITQYEHYANASPWIELQTRGYLKEVRVAPVDATGRLDPDRLAELIDRNTRVVSVSGASNVYGAVSPLEAIRARVREQESYFVVDAVHLVPHLGIDVGRLDLDFVVFSGYKLFSTYGSFLYGKPELLDHLTPYKVKPSPHRIPSKWEHGNRDPAMFAAINAVVDYLAWLGSAATPDGSTAGGAATDARRDRVAAGMRAIHAHEMSLCRQVLEGMSSRRRLRLFGPGEAQDVERRVPTFSFLVDGVKPQEVVGRLWQGASVFVRQENFYSRAVEELGLETIVRASLAHYNTAEEATAFISELQKLAE